MLKVQSEWLAEQLAREKGLMFGWSVFSAGWFIGTAEQLDGVGVVEPRRPGHAQ